jgi:hypothetical protein
MNSVFPDIMKGRQSARASLVLQALRRFFAGRAVLLFTRQQVILSIFFHANSIAFKGHGNYVCYRLQPQAASLPGKLEFASMTMKKLWGGNYK